MKLSVAPTSRETSISSCCVITCSRIVLNTTATTTMPSVTASSSRAGRSTLHQRCQPLDPGRIDLHIFDAGQRFQLCRDRIDPRRIGAFLKPASFST